MNNTESIINRNQSFYSQVEKFALRKRTVYKIIESYGQLTDYEIAKKMKLPINSITGRRRELAQTYFIKEVWSKLNKDTDRPNTVWAITEPEERDVLIASKRGELETDRYILQGDLSSLFVSKKAKELISKRIDKINELLNNL